MKFGVRECANIVFRAKQPIRIGTATFQTGQPVLYIDTATTSSMEQSTTTVYAQGGRGNARLLAWEGEKTLTFSFTDALLSPVGFAILSGAGLFKRGNYNQGSETDDLVHFHMMSGATIEIQQDGSGKIDLRNAIAEFGSSATVCINEAPVYIMLVEEDGSLTGEIVTGTIDADNAKSGVLTVTSPKVGNENLTEGKSVMVDYYIDLPGKHVWEADITPETFGGNYYVEADTLFRDQHTGVDLPANLTFPNVRLQSNFTMTFAGTGDPSTFDFTMDAFPDYTYFDKKKKVLCVMQIVDSVAMGAESIAIQSDDPVMYHDGEVNEASVQSHDSAKTDREKGAYIAAITWKSGDSDSTDAAYLLNVKDSVNFGNYITITTDKGEEPLSNFAPEYTMSYGSSADAAALAKQYVEVSPDGQITGLKDTAGTPVVVTATFTAAATSVLGADRNRKLEVHVVTDGRASG